MSWGQVRMVGKMKSEIPAAVLSAPPNTYVHYAEHAQKQAEKQ